ncbi:alpha/beta fold hydrolase [Streptomyces sp. NPDC088789]|uniref:alpha/beta fold hydrolase n=1 Tax=Streptomyces sp. NPDC088789 TaxID=3365899 RepID=UPI00382F7A77
MPEHNDQSHSHLSFFSTSDGSLAYRDEGTGPIVALLHGGFLDHSLWDRQVDVLAREHGVRVIAPDARGHGASANASGPYRDTDDLAALLRHVGVGPQTPAVLVGISMGGALAVDTALEHPELVRAVVVSGVGTSEPSFVDPWSLDVLAAQQRALAAGDIEGWVDAFQRYTVGPHRSADDVDPEVLRRVRAMALSTLTKHTNDETDHRVPVTDTWKRATEIAVPVLAINGAIDSPDHLGMAERLVSLVPDGRAVSVPGSAHYPAMENPDAFEAELTRFLDGLPG